MMAVAASPPNPRPTPSTLWAHIYGPETGYIGLFSGRRHPGVKKLLEVESQYFTWPWQSDEAEAWLRTHAERGREVYAGGHLLTERQRVKLNAAQIRALYSDDDGAQVPASLPRPTAIVQSSPGRTQSYWRLTEAIDPRRAEQLNRRIAYAMGADPTGWDLTQLLRVVGMPNRKYDDAPIVELVDVRDQAYDPDELDRILPPLPAEAEREQAHVRTERRADATLTDADQRLLDTMFRGKRGEDRRRLYEGDAREFRKPDGSINWSGADLSINNAYAYFTDKDPERMDRLHRSSGLFGARPNPEKWDDAHYADGRTYGEGTIGTAIAGCKETYRDHVSRPADAEQTVPSPATDDPAALRAELTRLRGVIDNLADVVHVQQVRLATLATEHADCRATFQAMKDVISNKHLRGNETRVGLVATWEIESQRSRGITAPKVSLAALSERAGVSKNTVSRVIQQLSEDESSPFEREVIRTQKVGPDGETIWVSSLLVRPRSGSAKVSETLRAVAAYTPERAQHGGSPQAAVARWQCRAHPDSDVIVTATARCATCATVVGEPTVKVIKADRPLNHQVGDSGPEAPPVDEYVTTGHQLGDSDGPDELADRRAAAAVAIQTRPPDPSK